MMRRFCPDTRIQAGWDFRKGHHCHLSANQAVEFATLDWVDWLNHRRLMEPIGSVPPAEAEARYYAKLEQPALAA